MIFRMIKSTLTQLLSRVKKPRNKDKPIIRTHRTIGYRETVDFKELIGIWLSGDGEISLPTQMGTIHYGEDGGAHIIPTNPNPIITKTRQQAIQEIRNSLQRALIGNVPANLRAVTVEINSNTERTLMFYFDCEPTGEEMESASLTVSEYVSDFPPYEFQTEWDIVTLPYPIPIPDAYLKIHQRYEKRLNLEISAEEEITSFKKNALSDRSAFLNVLQKALLGHITPNLRAVCYEVKSEKEVTLEFYYDQKPSEEELQLAELSVNQLRSSLPSKEYLVDSKIIILPYPERLNNLTNNRYTRYEPFIAEKVDYKT